MSDERIVEVIADYLRSGVLMDASQAAYHSSALLTALRVDGFGVYRLCRQERAVMSDERTVLVRRGRWFWQATDPNEVLGLTEPPTIYRSRTRDGAVRKVTRQWESSAEDWEVVLVAAARKEKP